MFTRQTGSGLLVHRGLAARSAGPSLRRPVLRSCAVSLGRRLGASLPPRPSPRPEPEGGRGRALQGRGLATAVDDFGIQTSPYDRLKSSTSPSSQGPLKLSHMRPFDAASPLTIPEPPPPKPMSRMNIYGIPGDIDDLIPILQACLQVGKLDRAALLIQRLELVGASAEQRILFCNQYLRVSLEQMHSKPAKKQAEKLHSWYQLQVLDKRLPHTAETIACMLKASLMTERGPRLQRLVDRYMGMAPGEAGLRVLGMAHILTDSDLAALTKLCPTYNYAEETAEPSAALEPQHQESDDVAQMPLDSTAAEAAVRADDAPEVLPTPQRGQGLAALRQGLSIFSELQNIDISKLPPEEQKDIQQHLEHNTISVAVEKWRRDRKTMQKAGITPAFGVSSAQSTLSHYMASWMAAMEDRINKELDLVAVAEERETKTALDLERCLYGPILRMSDPSRLAALTILSVINLGAMNGIGKGFAVSRLVSNLARQLQEDIELQRRDEIKKSKRRGKIELADPNPASDSSHPSVSDLISASASTGEDEIKIIEPAATEDDAPKFWTPTMQVHIGSALLRLLIETAKIPVTATHPVTGEPVSQDQPAFTHMMQPRRGKRVGVVFVNNHLAQHLQREPMGDFIAKHLPMVAEPKPWKSFNEGGYLVSRTSLMRVKSGDIEQSLYIKAAIQRGSMDKVFQSLDVLGKTAWRINRQTLDVMMEAWNSGEEIANMPKLNPEFELPPEPDSSADPLQRFQWLLAVKAIENQRTSLHSQRCFMNLQLEIARAYRNQTIYFPHNVDYRGRAYPVPTYLNHMGADHTRALLMFAEGKKLGVSGLRWLKIHLANVYGLDKASFNEREAFADENVDNIVDSATNPFKGSRWWLDAEDPWQCLTACFELKAALELAEPTEFVSHLPIHQDGTCNGLQHYAALGGDTLGAKQVNLEPGDRPADVYSAVAELVKQAIDKDFEAGKDLFKEAAVEKDGDQDVTRPDPNSPANYARILRGKITRKVVKQTVMTNVYGVTFTGAKKQVCKQLDALYPNLGKENGISNLTLACYIARHIFNALASMFRGAHDIQYWLGEVGGRICRALTPSQLKQIEDLYAASQEPDDEEFEAPKKAKKNKKTIDAELAQQFRSTVVWTTPLQMPVVQPYRDTNMKEVRTCLQAVVFPIHDQSNPVNRRKQLQAFPPNFIHSLDASHMMLSALECHDLGLTFAAVHDSFWTHASDVDTMNTVLRDAFIQIHEEDVVGRLAVEFETRHRGSLYLTRIDSSSPVAKRIKEFRKTSGKSMMEELLMEHRRNTLRLSGEPGDLKKAAEIVTPASLYEEMEASEVDVSIQEDTKAMGIGEIYDYSELATPSHQVLDDDDGPRNEATPAPASDASKKAEDASQKTPRKSTTKATTPFWRPLTVPPVPKKGEFDVTRLRNSQYFFS
ncbi:hypothetical protein CDD83_9812 [Cordyceps sp. RAO-2017]|nr:hypothetical protein CDD83_9812 [Cordyceps sp. RAO-2017]